MKIERYLKKHGFEDNTHTHRDSAPQNAFVVHENASHGGIFHIVQVGLPRERRRTKDHCEYVRGGQDRGGRDASPSSALAHRVVFAGGVPRPYRFQECEAR